MRNLRACFAALTLVLVAGAASAQAPGHWSAGAPMPSARAEIAVAQLGGKIYVIGAFTGERELEIYDAATDRWSRGAPLPHSLHHPAAVGLDGKVYAIGGYVEGWTPTAAGLTRRASTCIWLSRWTQKNCKSCCGCSRPSSVE